MKFISFASRLAIMTVLAGATPVRAEDTTTPDPNAATVAATARLTAQTAYITAQTEKVKAQAAALGLPAVTGQTTLTGDKAGATEAWMLSSSALNEAAGAIAQAVRGDGPFLLLAKDQVVNLALADSLKDHIDTLSTAAISTWKAYCDKTGGPADLHTFGLEAGEKAMGLGAAPAAIGAVLGAFKVDTEIQGVAVAAEDAAFVNAVATKLKTDTVIVPSEIAALPSTGKAPPSPEALMGGWNRLAASQRALSDCRTRLAGKPESDPLTAQIAEIDRQLMRIDTFASDVTASSTDAPSLLARARLAEAIPSNVKVLRVRVEHAGGSLIKRTTVLTAFGYPAIALTSGLVVSYRLTDPRTGKVLKSDLLVCRTARTRLGKVQEGKVGVAGCGQTTLVAQTGAKTGSGQP
ncbi:hypothetical protein [Caulobacter segnis]|uniref:hypothetical protein n=1 Tax=Caulobacter segnis TaxID=88688 RepID=UPI001CC18A29|nr:hypothetical protein [Caulobacter segnis]UAL08697.1 hypothetical protein K8940_12825 [Caulobacter segnis]